MCGLGAGSGLAEELDMDPPRLRGIKTRGRRVLRIPSLPTSKNFANLRRRQWRAIEMEHCLKAVQRNYVDSVDHGNGRKISSTMGVPEVLHV